MKLVVFAAMVSLLSASGMATETATQVRCEATPKAIFQQTAKKDLNSCNSDADCDRAVGYSCIGGQCVYTGS
jgi:hypothetical protein